MNEGDRLTLYHGTSVDVAVEIKIGKCELQGLYYPDEPSYSGVLTDSKEYAVRYAKLRSRRLEEQTRSPFRPAIIVYEIPKNKVNNLGLIPGDHTGAIQYSTVFEIDPRYASDDYLAKKYLSKIEFDTRLPRYRIIYKVPNEYFKKYILLPIKE